jgi:hypothetical protein
MQKTEEGSQEGKKRERRVDSVRGEKMKVNRRDFRMKKGRVIIYSVKKRPVGGFF